MRVQRRTDLNTMVDASVTALQVWMGEQRINAELFAEDEQLRPLVAELLSVAALNSSPLERGERGCRSNGNWCRQRPRNSYGCA